MDMYVEEQPNDDEIFCVRQYKPIEVETPYEISLTGVSQWELTYAVDIFELLYYECRICIFLH